MASSRIKNMILLLLSVLLTSSFASALDHDSSSYVHEEPGGVYESRAYPSYLRHARGVRVGNNSGTNKLGRSTVHAGLINVLDFGARGDGSTDDTKAFQRAWAKACTSSTDVNLVVPQNRTYLLKQIRFQGPCTSGITMQVAGTVIASNVRSDYSKDLSHWLFFDGVENLVVTGGGIINGNGYLWWQNSCKINKAKPCTNAPTALTFNRCTNLVVNNLRIENAQQMHVSFEASTNVVASNLVVNSPDNSPNTDGIHIADTQNIQISSCTIGTGDDCISIVSGSRNVRATGITCGPGHGISIGSLGSRNSREYVSDVVVNGAKISGTTNGVRIKTWQGGSGSASNIKFQNIEMHNVENPIVIDQNYCDKKTPCKQQVSAVQVTDVAYQNIAGTSASQVAIDFKCSETRPCKGIVMQNVKLAVAKGGHARAVCNNVDFASIQTLSPGCP